MTNPTERERKRFEIDLSSSDGNLFVVIGLAKQLLKQEQLQEFEQQTAEAMKSGAGKTYEDLLEIVNSHVQLIDTSGWYSKYSDNSST